MFAKLLSWMVLHVRSDTAKEIISRASLRVQVSLKSNQIVDLMPIGEAAQRLGLRPSALRYYDERGLVSPSQRLSGRRMYAADALRRLAFINVAQRLGLPLSTSAG